MNRLIFVAAVLSSVAATAHTVPKFLDPSLVGPLGNSYLIGGTMRCPCETIVIAPPKGNNLAGFRRGVTLTIPVPTGSTVTITKDRAP